MKQWMKDNAGLLMPMLVVVVIVLGIHTWISQSESRLDTRIDRVEQRLDEKFERLEAKVDRIQDTLDARASGR